MSVHRGKTVTVADFKSACTQCFPELHFDWDTWLDCPGLPSVVQGSYATFLPDIDKIAAGIVRRDPAIDLSGLRSWDSVALLDALLDVSESLALRASPVALHQSVVREVGELIGAVDSDDVEVQTRYLVLCARCGLVEDAVPRAEAVLAAHGRTELVVTLFRGLLEVDCGRHHARALWGHVKHLHTVAVERRFVEAGSTAPLFFPSGWPTTSDATLPRPMPQVSPAPVNTPAGDPIGGAAESSLRAEHEHDAPALTSKVSRPTGGACAPVALVAVAAVAVLGGTLWWASQAK